MKKLLCEITSNYRMVNEARLLDVKRLFYVRRTRRWDINAIPPRGDNRNHHDSETSFMKTLQKLIVVLNGTRSARLWPSSDWIIALAGNARRRELCEPHEKEEKNENTIFSFISLSARHFRSDSSRAAPAREEKNAIIIKTATNYLNWIKRQHFFSSSLLLSASHSPSRVIWGIIYCCVRP